MQRTAKAAADFRRWGVKKKEITTMTRSQVRYLLLPLIAILVIGCSDGKARRRVAAMDTETLERLRAEYPADSEAGRLIAEELARRPHDAVRKPTQHPSPTGTPTVRPQQKANEQEEEKEWEKVATFGMITTVYMSPAALADKHHIAQVLHTLRSRSPVQQVWFYDKKSKAPTGVPMTDDQMLHWRAKYSINRNTGHEEFVFITVTDPSTSPPEISETKATIRPGYAD